jgi:hypothetical protein
MATLVFEVISVTPNNPQSRIGIILDSVFGAEKGDNLMTRNEVV